MQYKLDESSRGLEADYGKVLLAFTSPGKSLAPVKKGEICAIESQKVKDPEMLDCIESLRLMEAS